MKCDLNWFLQFSITVNTADHDGNHRCLVEKNFPIAFILPSRWWDGAESLVIEHYLFMT